MSSFVQYLRKSKAVMNQQKCHRECACGRGRDLLTRGSCMTAMEDDGNEMGCGAPNLNGNKSVTCGDQ